MGAVLEILVLSIGVFITITGLLVLGVCVLLSLGLLFHAFQYNPFLGLGVLSLFIGLGLYMID